MNLHFLFAILLSISFVVISAEIDERDLSCPVSITITKGATTGGNTVWNVVEVNSGTSSYKLEYTIVGTNVPPAWTNKVDTIIGGKTKTLKPSLPNSVVFSSVVIVSCKLDPLGSVAATTASATTGAVSVTTGSASATTASSSSGTTTGLGTGAVGGDPDFTGFNGEKYRVSGEPGYYFNLISSKDLQVNGFFDNTCEGSKGTVITVMAIKIKDHEILLDLTTMGTLDGAPIGEIVNGEVSPKLFVLDDETSLSRPWINNFEFITRDFNISMNRHIVDFSIQKPGMVFYGTNCQVGYFNMQITGMRGGIDAHGLLGQTANHRHSEKNLQHPLSHSQGEGEIQGVEQDYIVNSPFGNDFSFNRNVHRVR